MPVLIDGVRLALELSQQLGWALRDLTAGGPITADLRVDRLNIVVDDRGSVTEASVY